MAKSAGKKSDDLIKHEGRTAKAQGKRPNANPNRGAKGFLETEKEYDRRLIAAELWSEGYGESD